MKRTADMIDNFLGWQPPLHMYSSLFLIPPFWCRMFWSNVFFPVHNTSFGIGLVHIPVALVHI
jgi:hypothetical protein